MNQAVTQSLPETGFVRLSHILSIFPVSRSTWWRGVKTGKFPKATQLSAGITAWKAEDIRALLHSFERNP